MIIACYASNNWFSPVSSIQAKYKAQSTWILKPISTAKWFLWQKICQKELHYCHNFHKLQSSQQPVVVTQVRSLLVRKVTQCRFLFWDINTPDFFRSSPLAVIFCKGCGLRWGQRNAAILIHMLITDHALQSSQTDLPEGWGRVLAYTF